MITSIKALRLPAILLSAIVALATGCRPREACAVTKLTAGTTIASLSGPEQMKAGEQAIITIAARNTRRLCVDQALASFETIGKDTLLLKATLEYTDKAENIDCGCKTDSLIYTLLYFTPLRSGAYYIMTRTDASSHLDPANNTDFIIDVE